MRKVLAPCAFALGLAFAGAEAAHADPPPVPTADRIKFAMSEHDLGYAAYKLDHYDEAANHFENAYFAAPNPEELGKAIAARAKATELARAGTLAVLAQRRYPRNATLGTMPADTIAAAIPHVHEIALRCKTECSVVVDGHLATLERATDTRFFVEPGHHEIEVDFGDDRTRQQTVEATAGGKSTLTMTAPPAPPKPPPPRAAANAAGSTPVALTTPSSALPVKTIGYVVGAAGLLGIGVGSVLGAMAISRNSDSKTTCDANNVCDAAGKSLRDDARAFGNISTIAFIAGGALLATGISLVLLAPSKSSMTTARIEAVPSTLAGGGGLLLRGQF